MSATNQKTNAMRTLDRLGIPYQSYSYDNAMALSGLEVSALLGKNPDQLFKTLVTVGKSGKNFVFMIPASKELHLKKAAFAAAEKSIEMIPTKDLLPLTGYVHGGCSPIGMKKAFPVFIDASAQQLPLILCSAGRIGYQVELSLDALVTATHAQLAELT